MKSKLYLKHIIEKEIHFSHFIFHINELIQFPY